MKRKTVRYLSTVLSLIMLFGCIYTVSASSNSDYAAEVSCDGTQTKYPTFEAAFAEADSTPGCTLKLLDDVSGNITVTGEFTLDLNGYDIVGASSASVITLEEGAVFTLTDESIFADGKVSGGKLTNGGAVTVYGAIFNMQGGTLCNNTASCGGGIFVSKSGKVFMSGGRICNNEAMSGGGVYVHNSWGSFTMSGGVIEDNTADEGNSIYNACEFILEGGEIVAYGWGSIMNEHGADFLIRGGTLSTADVRGSAVYNYGGVHISGGVFKSVFEDDLVTINNLGFYSHTSLSGGEFINGLSISGDIEENSTINNALSYTYSLLDNNGRPITVEDGEDTVRQYFTVGKYTGEPEPLPEETTEETTTEETTTEEITTEESTTQEVTTEEATTEEMTTQEPATEELTTEEITTDESTTQEVTTEEYVTEESTTVNQQPEKNSFIANFLEQIKTIFYWVCWLVKLLVANF